jgi:hypothetical protein
LAPGYIVASGGSVTRDVIAQYITIQSGEAEDDDLFRFSET